jgi:hypothetical protein
MRRTLCFFVLLLSLLFTALSFAGEEFYIVTEAPVAVGGGIIRHYMDGDMGRVSARYSYGGTSANAILIEKISRSSGEMSSERETIRVPFARPKKNKKGLFKVGSHLVHLQVRRSGRVVVKEIK